jgi:hypothetical protein
LRDVIFNEDLSGCLGIPHTLSPKDPVSPVATSHPVCDHICTHAGCDYDEALQLKELCTLERAQQKQIQTILVETEVDGGVEVITSMNDDTNGGVMNWGAVDDVSVDVNISINGGVNALFACHAADIFYLVDVLANFLAFLAPLHFLDDTNVGSNLCSLIDNKPDILWDHFLFTLLPISLFLDINQSIAFTTYSGPCRVFDLSKEPLSYAEAIMHPDTDVW